MKHIDRVVSAFNLGKPFKSYGTEVRTTRPIMVQKRGRTRYMMQRVALYHRGKLLAFMDNGEVYWRAPSTRAEQRLVQRLTSAHRVTSARAYWYGLRKDTTAPLSQWNQETEILEALK